MDNLTIANEKDISRRLPELSWETSKIYDRLKAADIGEIITYKELSVLINHEDMQNNCRWYLESARRKLQADKQLIFDVVPNKGVRRLDNEGKIDCGDTAIKKVRRAANRGMKKLSCVDIGALTNQKKTELFARMSILGAMKLFSNKKTVKGLEDRVKLQPKFLNYKPNLDLFK